MQVMDFKARTVVLVSEKKPTKAQQKKLPQQQKHLKKAGRSFTRKLCTEAAICLDGKKVSF